MTEPDFTRQLTLSDVNTNGCPHEKPMMGTGRPRAKCFLCQPHGKPPKRIVQCSCCGKVFMFNRGDHHGGRGFWYCGDACFAYAPSQNHRVKDLARLGTLYPTPRHCKNCGNYFSPARKAKQREVSVEKVDPILVFERDGWKCHICGVQTDKAKRGTYEDDAPELDHITTLSEGGEHSYRNTACACRSCNLQKGGKSFGQMHLGLL